MESEGSFIFDMNNTINKIMGIGFVKNTLAAKQNINIYQNPGFNNYIYKSNYYIPLIETQLSNQEIPDNLGWKPWCCPVDGCSKCYTHERSCSKHHDVLCVHPYINNHYHYFDYITKEWLDFIETEFVQVIFYGKTHLKRGGAFSRFPLQKLKSIHLKFLFTLFIIINPNQFQSLLNGRL